MAAYTPLQQDELIEKNGELYLGEYSRPRSMWQRLASSPLAVGLAVALLLLINVVCLTHTMRQVRAVAASLRPDLYVDTRDLPRPDQYEGIKKLYANSG